MSLNLVLHNWKCFESVTLNIPTNSFAIIDDNGSGKTSIISAVYSLLENKPWPGTKVSESLKQSAAYYGILTPYPQWSLSGQIGNNGRLKNNYQKPESNPMFSQQKPWPFVFTYLPSDNDWFFKSGSQKLGILDSLLGQAYRDYSKKLKSLEKAVRAKNKYLKYCRDNELSGDVIQIKQLGDQILEASKKVWEIRKKFLDEVNSQLKQFEGWIESQVRDWGIDYRISDSWGVKRPFDKVIRELNDVDYTKLWQKELIVGRCFFGAQRDEFDILSNRKNVQTVLSRGEMRLLVLFIKNIAKDTLIQENGPETRIWWFLDDVYNELDESREKILWEKVLNETDYYIITGTKKLDLDIPSYKVRDLVKK